MGMVASRKQEGPCRGWGWGVQEREEVARGDITREKHGSFRMFPEAAA